MLFRTERQCLKSLIGFFQHSGRPGLEYMIDCDMFYFQTRLGKLLVFLLLVSPVVLKGVSWELNAFLKGKSGEVEQAIRWNRALHYRPEYIRRVQAIIGCPATGYFDRTMVIALAKYQSRNWAHVNGRLTLFTRFKMKLADFHKTIRRERRISIKAALQKSGNIPGVYAPSGWYKTVYFLFGYRKKVPADQRARRSEYFSLFPNMAYAFARGLRVVYRPFASYRDFQKALTDPTTAGIIWSGHGYAYGVLQDASGCFFAPLVPGRGGSVRLNRHLYKAYRRFRYRALAGKRSKTRLSFLVLASCQGKRMEAAWRRLIGQTPVIISWKPRISVTESMHFYAIDSEKPRLLDLIQGVLRLRGKR